MALEDIAMFRAVHGSAVFYPSDAVSTERLTETMARRAGINYLRTSRPKTAILYSKDEKFPVPGFKVAAAERAGSRHRDRRGHHRARSAEGRR